MIKELATKYNPQAILELAAIEIESRARQEIESHLGSITMDELLEGVELLKKVIAEKAGYPDFTPDHVDAEGNVHEA